jgi:hypothetical protein
LSEFSLKELRYMKQAQYYFDHGQSDMTAYSVVVKLMSLAGIKVDQDFEDGLDRAYRIAKERAESRTDVPDTAESYQRKAPTVGTSRTGEVRPPNGGSNESEPGTLPPVVGDRFFD